MSYETDVGALCDLLCVQLRKGPAVEEKGGAIHIYGMPHVEEAGDLRQVDVHFITIGVRQWLLTDENRLGFNRLCDAYPQPERLAGGPSYIELGGVFGDQGVALMFLAIGEALDLWNVITPGTMGITGPEADRLAGGGMVMCSGYSPAAASQTVAEEGK